MKNILKIAIVLMLIHTSLFNNINAQTNLIISGGNFVISGNNVVLQNTKLINNSIFHSGSGEVVITGDAADANSEIGGTSPTTFYNLIINKTSNGALLANDVTISNQLTLTNGNLDINNSDLIIDNTGSISGGSSSSYVKTSNMGVLTQEVSGSNTTFPVGNQSYTPITLNNAGTTDDYNVRVENVVYQNGTSGNALTTDVVNATWFVDEATTGGSDVTATFQWNTSDELTDFNRTQSFVSVYHTLTWNNGTASAASGNNPYTQTESGITTFSPFIIASDATVLPVELLYFYGEKQGKNVLLSWETATEINNDYFDVEWSLDGIHFEKIGQVKGAGTTLENQSYEFIDNRTDVLQKHLNHYYRLRQVDFDEKFEYTNIINIQMLEQSNIQTLKIFPNPAAEYIHIETAEIGEIAQIIDIQGRILQAFQIKAASNQYQVSSLPAGTYFVRVGKEIKKIVIAK